MNAGYRLLRQRTLKPTQRPVLIISTQKDEVKATPIIRFLEEKVAAKWRIITASRGNIRREYLSKYACVFLLISDSSVHSTWFQVILRLLKRPGFLPPGIPVIPIRLDKTELPTDLAHLEPVELKPKEKGSGHAVLLRRLIRQSPSAFSPKYYRVNTIFSPEHSSFLRKPIFSSGEFQANRIVLKRPFGRILHLEDLNIDTIAAGAPPGGPLPPPDPVYFSVTSRPMVRPGSSFIVNVWGHLDSQRKEVMVRAKEARGGVAPAIQSAGPASVARGTRIHITLDATGLKVAEPQAEILWVGEIANATFSVQVPARAPASTCSGVASIYVEGVRIVRVEFEIKVGNRTLPARSLDSREFRPRSAFASYASSDRNAVLRVIQGMQKIAPNLDVFLDVLKLRSGENWAMRLRKEIPARDVFYLFWSRQAKKSKWVGKEWHFALKIRGLKFIEPLPLVSPEVVPPPRELAKKKHFNDWVNAFIRTTGGRATESVKRETGVASHGWKRKGK